MNTAVVIMSKVPQPGFAKTRLNTVLSEQDSMDFQHVCLLDTCRAVMDSELPGYIYYLKADSPIAAANGDKSIKGLINLPEREASYFQLCPQQGNDLGERLYLASREILSRYEAVLLLGSDLPGISAELILEAQNRIRANDIVIGPARDGGYYLLAIKRDFPDIFADIPWGSGQVFEKTMNASKQQQLICSLLPFQTDIDTWRDLLDFYYEGRAGNKYYQDLATYKLAGRLVKKYGEPGRELQI